MSLIEEEISIGSYLDALGEFADEDNLQAGIEFINVSRKPSDQSLAMSLG